MFGTHACLASRLDLVSVGDEPSESVNFFVVNVINVVHTELTEFPSSIIPRSSSAPSTGSAAGTSAESPSA